MGGSGGGSAYYEELNRLYGKQAETADLMLGVARDTVIPGYRGLMDQARDYGSIANQEFMAGRAQADAAAAFSGAQQAMDADLASMGIDPGDERSQRARSGQSAQAAAAQAAAATGARDQTRGRGFAMQQDVVSMGLGMPSNAAAAYGNAGAGYGNMAQMQMQQQRDKYNAVGDAVQGGMNLYRAWYGADGGYVTKRGIPRMANGGFLSVGPITPPPAAPPAPRRPGPVGTAAGTVQSYRTGQGMAGAVGRGVEAVGTATGSPSVTSFGAGMQTPSLGSYQAAQKMVDTTLPQLVDSAATTYGTTAGSAQTAALAMQDASVMGTIAPAAADAAAGTALAAGTGEAAAGSLLASGIGGTVAAAVPYVGAALALGSALGLFRDGGSVRASDYRKGGEVDGPGGPHDDAVPAMLSDGEFVLNAEATAHFGLDRLNKMNQKGLEIRRGLQRR